MLRQYKSLLAVLLEEKEQLNTVAEPMPEKQYELVFQNFGRGFDVYNAAEFVKGNWKKVADISFMRNIKYYEELPADVQKQIRIKAETSDRLDSKKEYELGYGHLGNGTTVWNKFEEENGDYKTVAHIENDGEVKIYDKDMPSYIREEIKRVARGKAVKYADAQAGNAVNTVKNKVITDLMLMFGEDTALKLREAFDDSRQEGFYEETDEAGTLVKQRRIKKALYGVFGNDEVNDAKLEKAYNILTNGQKEIDKISENAEREDEITPQLTPEAGGIPPVTENPKIQELGWHREAAELGTLEKAAKAAQNNSTPYAPEQKPLNIPKTRAEKLYAQFEKMFPQIVSGEYNYMRFGKKGDVRGAASAFEPLTVEHLGGNRYSFMTWYIQ
jgi:hypothetical protein